MYLYALYAIFVGHNYVLLKHLHAILAALTTYIAAKIYRNAYGEEVDKKWHVILVIGCSIKTHYTMVRMCMNDTVYVLFSQLFILCMQKSQVFNALIFYGIALSLKMSGLLLLPAFLLLASFRHGILIGAGLVLVGVILF